MRIYQAVSVTSAGPTAHAFLDGIFPGGGGGGHSLDCSELAEEGGMKGYPEECKKAAEEEEAEAEGEGDVGGGGGGGGGGGHPAAGGSEESETSEDVAPRRKKKFSAARAFFEGQQRVAATAGLASPTGSAPRVRRSRVNEMAKLFQAGRPIPVEEFVVDLDPVLPDATSPGASPERELPPTAIAEQGAKKQEEEEAAAAAPPAKKVEHRKKPPAKKTQGVDRIMLPKKTASNKGKTEVDSNPAPPTEEVSRLSKAREFSENKTLSTAATFAKADASDKASRDEQSTGRAHTAQEDVAEMDGARPPVEGQEAPVEGQEASGEGHEAPGEGQEAASKEERPMEEEEESSVTSGSVREDVVQLVVGGKPPQPLPQPQRMTISSSTESLTEDQYEDVPASDSSDEFASDYEQLHNCSTKERPISLESFSGLAAATVPPIDEVALDQNASTAAAAANANAVIPTKFERAKEVGVENGVHYLEDGHFFYQMEPRTPSDSEEGEEDDDDDDYEMATPPHQPTRLRFSEDPITVYSTHSPSEYDRRNELIDPISANAEYELEKQLARMDVFPVRLNKGLRGLGISIMGVGLGRAPGVEKLGIFIKGITAGGPAEQDGQLKVLDQIVEVNGRCLVGVTQAEAAEVLRNTHGEVHFLIGRERPDLANCPGQGSSIVRLVERSIRAQECAQASGMGLGNAPLAESEDLRSPSDRSPSLPSKPFVPSLVPGSPTEPQSVSRLRDIEEQNEDMRSELEDLNAKVALLDGEEAASRFAALRDRYLAVQAREDHVRRERDHLERQLAAKEELTQQREFELNEQIINLNADLEQSQERVRCLREENADLAGQLRDAEARIERISAEMNEQVRRLEAELERMRESSSGSEVSALEEAQARSSLNFSAERHRAAVAQNGSSLAGRRRPSRGKARQSASNKDITFSNGHNNDDSDGLDDARFPHAAGDAGAEPEEGDGEENEAETSDGFEDMAAVFSSHSPDSTLARGPKGGVAVLPGGNDVLSMMQQQRKVMGLPSPDQEASSSIGSEGDGVRIRGMSVEDLCDHLRSQECSWAETYVRYNGVDGARFLSLDTADMKSMGISSAADRANLKKKIKEMKKDFDRCRPSV